MLLLFGGNAPTAYATSSFVGAFVTCAVIAIVMAVVYGVALLALRNAEAVAIASRLRRMLPGSRA